MGGNRGKWALCALDLGVGKWGIAGDAPTSQVRAKRSPTVLVHIKQEYRSIVHSLSYMLQSRRHDSFMLCSHETATDWIPAVIAVNARFSSQSFAPR
jgi:hypothetical protein